jgi:hypothetical protein
MIVGGIAINLMDHKKIKEKRREEKRRERERENERFGYLSNRVCIIGNCTLSLNHA